MKAEGSKIVNKVHVADWILAFTPLSNNNVLFDIPLISLPPYIISDCTTNKLSVPGNNQC